jgi:hypothetical protein
MATFVSVAALAAAMIALAYAWRLNQELDSARERLDRYNRSLFKAEEAIRTLRTELEGATTRLRIEIMRRAGDAHFLPQTTVREATLLHPQAQQILANYHVGGCSSCAAEPDETLAELCVTRNIREADLLANLNELLNATDGASQAQLVRVPNVRLELD